MYLVADINLCRQTRFEVVKKLLICFWTPLYHFCSPVNAVVLFLYNYGTEWNITCRFVPLKVMGEAGLCSLCLSLYLSWVQAFFL